MQILIKGALFMCTFCASLIFGLQKLFFDLRNFLDLFWGFILKRVHTIRDPRISWLPFGTKNHEMRGPPVLTINLLTCANIKPWLNRPIKVTSRLGFCKTFYCIDKTLSSQIEKSLRKKREKKSFKYKDIEHYSRPCISVSWSKTDFRKVRNQISLINQGEIESTVISRFTILRVKLIVWEIFDRQPPPLLTPLYPT